MLFNSYEFLWVFLPLVGLGFIVSRSMGITHAIIWLLACSIFFYSWWNPPFVLLLIGSVLFNYFMQRKITQNRNVSLLVFAITCNLSLLFYYKYSNFFLNLVSSTTDAPFSIVNVTLPLAISFFSFQQIAYLYDAFNNQVKKHTFLEYSLFVIFFPQLIAGPIVSQRNIIPQFKSVRALSPRAEDLAAGITIFAIGLFKKVVIADTMAGFASPVFENAAGLSELSFLEAWTGALSFTLQLYFDFSGYSDMALGLGRLFGIHLPINFNSPYKARSIIDFWRRWHITLSQFLRDYLYIPLGGSKGGITRRYVNLLIVMLLGGLWHGAGWTFILWGGLHGIYLIMNHCWINFCKKTNLQAMTSNNIYQFFSWFLTFIAVTFAWVLFRAENFTVAYNIYHAMLGFNGIDLPHRVITILGPLGEYLFFLGIKGQSIDYFELWQPKSVYWIASLLFIVLYLPNTSQWLSRYVRRFPLKLNPPHKLFIWRPTLGNGVIILCLLFYTVFYINDAPTEFLYFQF